MLYLAPAAISILILVESLQIEIKNEDIKVASQERDNRPML